MYGNDNFFNRIQISEWFMQFMTLMWAMEDLSNNDLMAELQRQNREYLEKILDNQNEILSLLKDISNSPKG